MGDSICVKEPMDRCLARRDEKEVEEAMNELVKKFKLKDVWREMHKEKKGYTFIQKAMKSMARIDRMYMTKELEKLVYVDNETNIQNKRPLHGDNKDNDV